MSNRGSRGLYLISLISLISIALEQPVAWPLTLSTIIF
jgi:hypothetical protein